MIPNISRNVFFVMFLLVLNKELRKALKLNEENTKEETLHCYLLSYSVICSSPNTFKYNSDLLMAVNFNKQNKENVLQGKIKLLLYCF